MHIAGTTVVAQSLPQAQHLVFTGSGQRLDGRELLHESQPVIASLLDARLLQDDLAHPDAVRVTDATPRQFAPILRKPPQ